MSVTLRNANFTHTAHAQFGYPYSMGLAHAHPAGTIVWAPCGVAVHMVGSVFNMNDSGSERDTESEDRDQRRRRLATLRKQRQRSKNADNDRKHIRHTETQQASQRRSNESREHRQKSLQV